MVAAFVIRYLELSYFTLHNERVYLKVGLHSLNLNKLTNQPSEGSQYIPFLSIRDIEFLQIPRVLLYRII